ncbi:MAG TPA: hypothetical protein VHA57_13890 [Actinomycetota bacterium]|nr:hypothetical protein [Actinomycetota bacterium]
MRFTIVDTSVLCELLEVPGLSSRPKEVQEEFRQRLRAKERLVLPVTAVIETGNHIAQVKTGNKAAAVARFATLLAETLAGGGPFILTEASWDAAFVAELCRGNSTGQSLSEHALNAGLGAGDLAILVERDRLLAASAYTEAFVWTLDRKLLAFNR